MDAHDIEADYVVVGSGAAAMSFVDVILAESEASVIMIDRRAKPGGHWNDAYPFVRLHQPSAFYGVNSTPLGRGIKDERGSNAGMYELAGGDEVRTYFDRVMRDIFVPSGRVQYFPMSEYTPGDPGQVMSRLTGDTLTVRADKKVVDARYLESRIPSTEPPPFAVAPGVDLVPVNKLVRLSGHPQRYVIIGAGKTSADACLWLLENGVNPSTITWIRPRDAWFFNRASFQGGAKTLSSLAEQVEVAANAKSLNDIFLGFEACGQLLRIDHEVWPTMFRFATTTVGECGALGQIADVVRLGHILGIAEDGLTLEEGTISRGNHCLYVDCSAAGIPIRPPVPVFTNGRITLQYIVYTGQPTFSAALTGLIEIVGRDDMEKNSLCSPLPVTGDLLDVPRNLLGDLGLREKWLTNDQIQAWMEHSRLNAAGRWGEEAGDAEEEAGLLRFLGNVNLARANLEAMLAAESADPSAELLRVNRRLGRLSGPGCLRG
jgi:hypothetical protein